MTLSDEELVAAVGGRLRDQLLSRLAGADTDELRRDAGRAGLALLCRCDPAYPIRLRDLASPPSVLHIAGDPERLAAAAASEPVAIVGSRAGSAYGTGVARALARGLAAAGVPVISGMAMGIDSAAHEGALSVGGRAAPSLAVLPGPASDPYPRGARGLHRRLLAAGAAISEMPPGVGVRPWMFLARNRIIAGLAAMTVVVEAGEGSAALLTTRYAAELGRPVGAVPGRVTFPQAIGPNQLIREGAHLISRVQDVLDLLFEAGTRSAPTDDRPALSEEMRAMLAAIEQGHDTPGALLRRAVLPEDGLAALASLELAGYVQRGAGGRFIVLP
jgi:DNA processing protein